jgi:hypothetical protein
MDYLAELTAKIYLLHGCGARHIQTVPVKEIFEGKTVWDGEVEVFDLIGHAKAKRCYAWGYTNEKHPDKLDVVAVLEIPPVMSPETAVRAAVTVYAKSSAPCP